MNIHRYTIDYQNSDTNTHDLIQKIQERLGVDRLSEFAWSSHPEQQFSFSYPGIPFFVRMRIQQALKGENIQVSSS